MAKCIICDHHTTGTVCPLCERVTGVRELAPPRRRLAPCTRCQHAKLVRVVPRQLSVESSRSRREQTDPLASHGPMTATYPIKTVADRLVPPTALDGLGVFECYICKRCGFVEWYCQDPEHIPIGPQYMTEDLDLEASPYR